MRNHRALRRSDPEGEVTPPQGIAPKLPYVTPKRVGTEATKASDCGIGFPGLPTPPRGYDLRVVADDKLKSTRGKSGKFESYDKVRQEEVIRVRDLRRYASRPTGSTVRGVAADPDLTADQANGLADRLLARRFRQLVPTFASSRFVRVRRLELYGQVAPTIDKLRISNVALFTVISPTWCVPGGALSTVHPKRLLEQFRSQLNRAGLASHCGWFIATLHGRYDVASDSYELHIHAIVVGEKYRAFDILRHSQTYQPTEAVKKPIRRTKLKAVAVQLPYYLLQPFWPSRIPSNGTGSNSRARHRIPEPRHAEWLIWIDQWRFSDMVLMHGCAFVGGRLRFGGT